MKTIVLILFDSSNNILPARYGVCNALRLWRFLFVNFLRRYEPIMYDYTRARVWCVQGKYSCTVHVGTLPGTRQIYTRKTKNSNTHKTRRTYVFIKRTHTRARRNIGTRIRFSTPSCVRCLKKKTKKVFFIRPCFFFLRPHPIPP